MRIVLGTADLREDAESERVLDAFHAAGGRRLDAANVYGDGESARVVGRWLARRGHHDVELFMKGCHPPDCAPGKVAPEVERARSLLGVDRLDVFVLHRDDPSVPVEAFAAALVEERDAGRIGAFGVSNWTLPRFHALAAALGDDAGSLRAFSNHFSLAEMVTAPWEGCLAMSRTDIAALGAQPGVVALAWACLAGGFLAGHNAPGWASEPNRARRARAEALARELGTTATAVALAYVLHQGEHVLAAVGTRSEKHLAELLDAQAIQLTGTQAQHLESG